MTTLRDVQNLREELFDAIGDLKVYLGLEGRPLVERCSKARNDLEQVQYSERPLEDLPGLMDEGRSLLNVVKMVVEAARGGVE